MLSSLKLEKDKNKVYILAPAARHTGGPELLHQLGAELRKNGVEAYMYYYPSIAPKPVHVNYLKYNVPFVRHIPDSSKNVVIVPEVQIPRALKFKKAKVAIWWLSVDNFFVAQDKAPKESVLVRYLKFGTFSKKDWSEVFKRSFAHLVQSFYATEFLKDKGLSSCFLSDYLNSVYLSQTWDVSDKKDLVCYNPKKGFEFTKALIEICPEINFVPLINMSPDQVVETLRKAKVYIDFGEHPGKDRIPREAAMLGACVIVGRKGSASNDQDVPIPDEFKFGFNPQDILLVKEKILNIFSDFTGNQEKLASYISKIKSEQLKFQNDVREIF